MYYQDGRRDIESYALNNGLSFKEAKRRKRKKRKKNTEFTVVRGAPVAGTGKPKGD